MDPHDGEPWRRGERDALDVWLRETLRAAHGPTASEPVPEELLRLLDAETPADARQMARSQQ
jgi:hypothetical protein